MAIFASGCRWTGTNTSYRAGELQHHFQISETRYVITARQHLETVREAAALSGMHPEIVIFTDILDPCRPEQRPYCPLRTLHDLMHDGDEATLQKCLHEISPDSVAALFSTSGTTGLPKMAARTHRALVLESAAIEDRNAAKDYEVRRLYCTPIFHAFSTSEMICNALRLGQTTFFMERFSDLRFPRLISQHRITETSAPPPMLIRIVNNADAHSQIQSLRAVFTGGAPLAPELAIKFQALFEIPPRIVQVWGMTEGGWFTTFKYPEQDITGSVGHALPGYKIRIGDDHRIELSGGIVAGEVLVSGPGLMTGYLANETETKNAFDQGWLRTGDIGYLQDGKLFLIDRAKDLIKVNGWQVAPAEIENALLSSNDVEDAGVIGAGHGTEEHPLAFVVRKHESLTSAMVKQHLLQHLARYKVGQCEIRFTDVLPKSVSGKILKNELRNVDLRSQHGIQHT